MVIADRRVGFRVSPGHSFTPRTFTKRRRSADRRRRARRRKRFVAPSPCMQKNMSYVRVEHFVPLRKMRRVRLRSPQEQTPDALVHVPSHVGCFSPLLPRETGRLRSRATRFTQTPLLCDFPVHPLRLSAQVDDMMHGGVCFDREGSLGTASRASPPRAGASPRRAGGTRAVDRGSRPLGRAGAAARPRHASARGHQLGTERPFVARSEASVNSSCRSPRPRPRAPHPRRTRTRRCPRRRRETPRLRRPRTPEGS